MKTIITLVTALFFVSKAALAGGGGGGLGNIVYDPTNHAENLVTAARSIVAEEQRAIQIYNQLLQHKAQLLGNQKLDPVIVSTLLNQNKADIDGLRTYIGGMVRLQESTNQLADMSKSRMADIRMSGLSVDDYVKREAHRIEAGD